MSQGGRFRWIVILVATLAISAGTFVAGYFAGRPSADELAGLPHGLKRPPSLILGGWEAVDSPEQVEFFRDWTYWYWNKPIIGRRIMGSFYLEGDSVVLRPMFYTRLSINDASPLSMKLADTDGNWVLRSAEGKVFRRVDQ